MYHTEVLTTDDLTFYHLSSSSYSSPFNSHARRLHESEYGRRDCALSGIVSFVLVFPSWKYNWNRVSVLNYSRDRRYKAVSALPRRPSSFAGKRPSGDSWNGTICCLPCNTFHCLIFQWFCSKIVDLFLIFKSSILEVSFIQNEMKYIF